MTNPFKPQPRKFSETSLKRAFKEFSINFINHYAPQPHIDSPDIEYNLINNELSDHKSTIRITFPAEESLSEYGLQLKRFIESLPLSIDFVETWFEFDINYNFNRSWKPVRMELYKNGEKIQ